MRFARLCSFWPFSVRFRPMRTATSMSWTATALNSASRTCVWRILMRPEYYQTCKRADKSTYNCGIKAREKLESLLKLGELSCKTVGRDIYNRDMSECFAGRTNINRKWYAAAGLWCIKAGTPPIWRRRRCKTRQTRNMAGQIYEARAVSDFV